MSDISQSNPILQVSDLKIKKENKTDFDFEVQEKQDMFIVKRILRFGVLLIGFLAIIYVLIICALHLWQDVTMQVKIINKLIDNIVVIISAAFYILGVNFLYKKN